MQWISPTEKDSGNGTLEKRLWESADQFRANSGLKAQEYSGPILGIIFLRFAEVRFAQQRAKLEKAGATSRRGSRVDEPAVYHAAGVLYLAPDARFDFLLNLPEADDIGGKVNDAMRDIEKYNPQLAGVLPKTYNLFTSTLLKELFKKISENGAPLKKTFLFWPMYKASCSRSRPPSHTDDPPRPLWRRRCTYPSSSWPHRDRDHSKARSSNSPRHSQATVSVIGSRIRIFGMRVVIPHPRLDGTRRDSDSSL